MNKSLSILNLRRAIPFVLAALATAFSPPPAAADGIVLPPLVSRRLPEMPRQRALIAFRDGMETLIVESSFRGEGGEMAWIVPVPARPTAIGEASSGIFTTLEFGLQPIVRDSAGPLLLFGIFLFLWGVGLMVSGRFVPIRAGMMAVLCMLILSVGMFSLGGRAGERSTANLDRVRTSDAIRVGNYDVQLLEVASPEMLNAWLAANGFREVPETGRNAVAAYVSEGWQFVAARLRKESEGYSQPHPLSITFPAARPVYPMRLTQLAGSNLHLDLFVVANDQAECPGLYTTYVDIFAHRLDTYIGEFMRGRSFGHSLGLPSLVALMRDHCVLTWLRGELTNDQLGTDITFRFKPPDATRDSVFTRRGAILVSVERGSLVAGAVFLAAALIGGWRARRGVNAFLATAFVLGAFPVGALIASINYALTPYEGIAQASAEGENLVTVDDVVNTLHEYPEVLERMTLEDVRDYFRDALASQKNRWTGMPVALVESPGDLLIVRDDYGIVVRKFAGLSRFEPIGIPRDTRVTGKPPGNP